MGGVSDEEDDPGGIREASRQIRVATEVKEIAGVCPVTTLSDLTASGSIGDMPVRGGFLMVTIRQLHIISPVAKTGRPSLMDSFHRVNSLLPEDQVVATVGPGTTVAEAIQLMREHGFSQLPVVEGNEVLGVFSFRSFAEQILEMVAMKGASLENLTVDEFIEELKFVHINDDPMSIFGYLDCDDAVLVGQPDRIQGIVTAMDVLRYLYRVASSFVLLGEIERSLRRLIGICLDDDGLRTCIRNSLAHQYEEDEMPSKLEEMTFNDYVQIVGDGRNWPRFEEVLGTGDLQRRRTRAKLLEIKDLRNDVFHFKRELTEHDLDVLAAQRNWLYRRARIVEARRKAGTDDGTG